MSDKELLIGNAVCFVANVAFGIFNVLHKNPILGILQLDVSVLNGVMVCILLGLKGNK